MKLKLVKNLIDNWQPSTLEITDYNISSIEENAFQDLKNLVLDVGPISLQENLFDPLISLNYLRIEIKYNPQSPLRYINNVLKTVPSIRVLEILNSDSINICDNPISNENSLPLTGLYYTGGSIITLPTNSLICLWNLEKLSISKTQLTTIEAGVFDSMTVLKYIYLAFNKLTHISTASNVFNVRNLEIIDLSNNSINKIDKEAFEIVSNKLTLLNLSYNSLDIIEEGIFKNIKCKVIDFRQNRIVDIADNAFNTSHVDTLNLLDNYFSTFNRSKWGLNDNTIVYMEYMQSDIAFSPSNKSISLIDPNDDNIKHGTEISKKSY
ncbi:carboxypeptidase N subunit 2-like [Aphidius gifuensis]|uniref:carboxypeptidase N subunit 2-like n=1 Tax=Aphidius gifuensis TaxID=684658 RepID=UPI001CDC03C9|nr:carboxypeptidase N subunit 2-like [Aphidius gifuensis]